MSDFSDKSNNNVQHIFVIGAKSIGQYGGYETFIDRLICEHESEPYIKYHVACKANGSGSMDENNLEGVKILRSDNNNRVVEFEYKNAHVFKIHCPNIGPGVAIYYDRAALSYSIKYCKDNNISNPIFYVLTCRIGLFIDGLKKKIKKIGGVYYLNPDGHEWKRAKWSRLVRLYWKWSEKKMVKLSDLVICDSLNIEKYIKDEYSLFSPKTVYIAYGADVEENDKFVEDNDYQNWLKKNNTYKNGYYLIVGRFVPENNFLTMIKEFMLSKSGRDLVLITNVNDKYFEQLNKDLQFESDNRIKFVGTVYDKNLLKKIREGAYAYIHGHEVGGTNPSLLEALGSTKLNLLLKVGFNQEVGKDAALYWDKSAGNLSGLIDQADKMDESVRNEYGIKAKDRIKSAYSWKFIGDEYRKVWER